MCALKGAYRRCQLALAWRYSPAFGRAGSGGGGDAAGGCPRRSELMVNISTLRHATVNAEGV